MESPYKTYSYSYFYRKTPLCPHREKYPFNQGSRLKTYVQQCPGWVEDPEERYTVNYIAIILLTQIRAKRQLLLDANDRYFLLCDHELQKALFLQTPLLELSGLRTEILGQMEHHEPLSPQSRYTKPFWCVWYMDNILKRIFVDLDECRDSILSLECPQF